jgi:NAD-dependent dihydropyrimidine dehydrogenase PreA subunit
MSGNDLIIYCKCIHRELVPLESREYILKDLSQSGLNAIVVDDLCGLAARHAPVLKVWAQSQKLTIIACYERAVRSLFDMADAPLPDDSPVKILNCRSLTPENIMDDVKKGGSGEPCGAIDYINHDGDREPWFPVIDRVRCRGCKLCFNFCLFGVYSVDDQGNVRVTRPDNCKNNCPACARVCPARAIIFPKIDQSPINGDEVDESKISPSPARLDLLQEEDIYTMLRNRSSRGQRFSPEPGPKTGLLEMLNRELDIPMDVLQALSPADLSRIQKKASSTGEQDA